MYNIIQTYTSLPTHTPPCTSLSSHAQYTVIYFLFRIWNNWLQTRGIGSGHAQPWPAWPCVVSRSQTAFFLFIYWAGKKGSGEQPIPFLLSDPQNPGMLLIGADLYNKGLLIGENDVHWFFAYARRCPPLKILRCFYLSQWLKSMRTHSKTWYL